MSDISIIVPVYNVKSFLKRCVGSILKQSYTDYEVVLVDDGSSDGSEIICDEYVASDERFVVIHQENHGLAAARNTALDWIFENSESRWLTFIDSDDWVHPEYLRLLLSANIRNKTRISSTGFQTVFSEDTTLAPLSESSRKVGTEEGYIDESGWINAYACGKLVSKELFRDIRFPEGKLWEDLAIMYKVLFQQECMSLVDDRLYYYYQNPKSITQSAWSVKRLDEIEAYESQLDFFKKKDTALYVAVLNAYTKAIVGQIRLIDTSRNKNFNRYRSNLSRKLLRAIREIVVLNRDYYSGKTKFVFYCLLFSNRCLSKVYDVVRKQKYSVLRRTI